MLSVSCNAGDAKFGDGGFVVGDVGAAAAADVGALVAASLVGVGAVVVVVPEGRVVVVRAVMRGRNAPKPVADCGSTIGVAGAVGPPWFAGGAFVPRGAVVGRSGGCVAGGAVDAGAVVGGAVVG
ncbi:MAG TPA: hypothetical protein VFX21_05860, partial [Acidimicrobiia bacterium]|nr:hypothetical protein [Acidimicrobiia bacterium]